MRNKLSSHLWKIATVALLTVMLVGGVVCVTDVKGTDAYAADVTPEDVTPDNVDYKIIKYSSITRTKDTETGLYSNIPQPEELNGGAWLFAGWYEDENCEVAYKSFPTGVTQAYAKFVPEKPSSINTLVFLNPFSFAYFSNMAC